MIKKINQIIVKNNEEKYGHLILDLLNQKKIIFIKNKFDSMNHVSNEIYYDKPAIIIKSSGSKNTPKFCLHSINNLNESAYSSGTWLQEQGFILKNCLILNTLPFYHISGVMPLWRSKIWKCCYKRVPPDLLRNTKDLYESTIAIKILKNKHLITSLVPTQLNRLLADKNGIAWLKLFNLIWVGGATISSEAINKCLKEKINLSPCYGATETAAMITALKPSEFLTGNKSSGEPLNNIKLNINKYGLIQIKTKRIGFEIINQQLKSIKDKNGWWESGDLGEIREFNNKFYLEIKGRGDSAFSSGGEIVFPDLIRIRVEKFIYANKIPIEKFIISKIKDKYWENKFEIIIKFKNNYQKNKSENYINLLKQYSELWAKHERPMRWVVVSEIIKPKAEIENWKNIQI